jgi:hypothetical protein
MTAYNESYFDPQYYFNQPHIRTTNIFKIKKHPNNNKDYDSYGIINDDGIDDIKIFTSTESAMPKLVPFGKCTIIKFKFPVPVKPGETVGSRFSFKVTSLFDNVTGSDIYPDYSISLPYFCSTDDEETSMLGKDNEIGIVPTLKGEGQPGGFDIFVYLPPKFIKVSGFTDATEKIDHYTLDGVEGEGRQKFSWKLRGLLKKGGISDSIILNSATRQGFNIDITGVIKEKYDSAADLIKIKEKVGTIPSLDETVKKVKKEVRLSTIIAVVAIIISIIGLIPFGVEVYKKVKHDASATKIESKAPLNDNPK